MTETANTPEPAAPGGGIPEQERSLAMLCHLIALVGMVFPFGNILGPLIVWLVAKDGKPFVDEQGKEALNFNITVAIGFLICLLLTLIVIGAFLMFVLWVIWLVFLIIAAIKANEGVHYRYPFAFRFVGHS